VSRFRATEYYTFINDVVAFTGNVRRVERGFGSFVTDAAVRVDELTREYTFPMSIVELGIGGGGSLFNWANYTTDTNIYGVDLFSTEHKELYDTTGHFGYFRENFERISADISNTQQLLLETDIVAYWGIDAYSEQSAITVEECNGAKLDFVLDDAAPDGGALKGLMSAWQDHISDNGVIITETPYGNGCLPEYNRSDAEKQQRLNELASQGMILFDMTEYQNTILDPPATEYIIPYLGFYAKDYNKFKDLLTKYQHNIVAGEQNWRKRNET